MQTSSRSLGSPRRLLWASLAVAAIIVGCGVRWDIGVPTGIYPPDSPDAGETWDLSGTGGSTMASTVGTGGSTGQPAPWLPQIPSNAPPLSGEGPLTGIWYGAVDLTAPGFYGPPVDELTVTIDSTGVHSLAFQRRLREVAIIQPGLVSPLGASPRPATFDADTVTASGFQLSYHGNGLQGTGGNGGLDGSGGAGGPMTVEMLSGTLDDTGRLAVTYAFDSTEPGGPTHAAASGLLNKEGQPQVPFADLHGRWYGTVNLDPGPDFAGGPLDQLTLEFDDAHNLRFLGFQVFSVLPLAFGDDTSTFPLTGQRTGIQAADSIFSFDATVLSATMSATVVSLRLRIRNHDGNTPATDYTVSLDGTLSGSGLTYTYALQGTMYQATIDAHSNGVLLP